MPELVKLVFTVPVAQAEAVRQALGDAGAGTVGNYSHTSFSVTGVGRFLPQEGANPAIGEVGQPEEVEEERVEITCSQEEVARLVEVLRQAHPYEEPAIDVYPLLDL